MIMMITNDDTFFDEESFVEMNDGKGEEDDE